MKRAFGVSLLSAIFGIIFYLIVLKEGVAIAAMIYMAALVTVVVIAIAVNMIVN